MITKMKPQLSLLIALVIFTNLIYISDVNASEATPGIYIERINDRSHALVPGLQSQYKICADSRQLYKRLFEQGGAGWEAVKKSLPDGYNVRAITAPEPDWAKEGVGKQTEKEYFFGEKYALYQYRNRYEISEAERCALIRHEDLVIDIDDGNQRTLATLKDKKETKATPGVSKIPLALQYKTHKVKRMPSPLTIRQKNDEALDVISHEEKIAKLLSLLFADTQSNRTPGVALSYDTKVTENLKDAMGYEESNASPVTIPRANDEHTIAGQPCDIISAKNMRSRLWYWDKMHYYPGLIERPILLKKEVTNQSKKVVGTEEAVKFRVLSEIDHSVFELDPSLK
jgi:hypothetical protein